MLESLSAAVAELVAADPAGLASPEAVVELQRLAAQMDAVTHRVTAAFDTARVWESDGARSASAWLAATTRLPLGACRQRVRLGRALRHLPRTEAAWLAGDLDRAHVAVLARARRPPVAALFDRDEPVLVHQATTCSYAVFTRAAAYWHQLADPDGADRDAATQRAHRRAHHSKTLDGMWRGDWWLDPIDGAIVDQRLAAIGQELFDADWAAAKARLGRDPHLDELARTPAQRRADALTEMAIRSGTAPAHGRRPAPLFSVVVGWETFHGRICELANGDIVAPGALIPWLHHADIERIVFGPRSRIIDVGHRRRLFTGALRRAIAIRDHHCYHPLCEEPAHRCQIDHIQPYAQGGPTTQTNGRLACGYHNRLRHKPGHTPDHDDDDDSDDSDDSDDD
jgi:hypothetical protein